MAKEWRDYFEESLQSCGMPVPPRSLYATAATALGTVSALVSALKTVATAKEAMTIAGLLKAARAVPVIEAVQIATLSELAAMAGGVLAAGYAGALIGAAIYATEKAYLGWSDKIIDWATASNDFASLEAKGKSLGIASTYSSSCSGTATMTGSITRLALDQRSGLFPSDPKAGCRH